MPKLAVPKLGPPSGTKFEGGAEVTRSSLRVPSSPAGQSAACLLFDIRLAHPRLWTRRSHCAPRLVEIQSCYRARRWPRSFLCQSGISAGMPQPHSCAHFWNELLVGAGWTSSHRGPHTQASKPRRAIEGNLKNLSKSGPSFWTGTRSRFQDQNLVCRYWIAVPIPGPDSGPDFRTGIRPRCLLPIENRIILQMRGPDIGAGFRPRNWDHVSRHRSQILVLKSGPDSGPEIGTGS